MYKWSNMCCILFR